MFRVIAYLFIPVDVFLTTAWVRAHAARAHRVVPAAAHRPAAAPADPDATLVIVVQWALVLAALAAATGRAPRLLGTAVFLLYAEWMVIAMSYGKVDHDRIAFLVALAVLPTVGDRPLPRPAPVGGGRLGDGGRRSWPSMLTYFLAAWAKIRFGGLGLADRVHPDARGPAPRHRPVRLDPRRAVAAARRAVGDARPGVALAPLMLLVRSDRARVGAGAASCSAST